MQQDCPFCGIVCKHLERFGRNWQSWLAPALEPLLIMKADVSCGRIGDQESCWFQPEAIDAGLPGEECLTDGSARKVRAALQVTTLVARSQRWPQRRKPCTC